MLIVEFPTPSRTTERHIVRRKTCTELAGKRRIPQAPESQLGMWLRLGPLGSPCAPATGTLTPCGHVTKYSQPFNQETAGGAKTSMQTPHKERSPQGSPPILTMLLAGGAGHRMLPLTREHAKPMITFGAIYRLIDIPLSNSGQFRLTKDQHSDAGQSPESQSTCPAHLEHTVDRAR